MYIDIIYAKSIMEKNILTLGNQSKTDFNKNTTLASRISLPLIFNRYKKYQKTMDRLFITNGIYYMLLIVILMCLVKSIINFLAVNLIKNYLDDQEISEKYCNKHSTLLKSYIFCFLLISSLKIYNDYNEKCLYDQIHKDISIHYIDSINNCNTVEVKSIEFNKLFSILEMQVSILVNMPKNMSIYYLFSYGLFPTLLSGIVLESFIKALFLFNQEEYINSRIALFLYEFRKLFPISLYQTFIMLCITIIIPYFIIANSGLDRDLNIEQRLDDHITSKKERYLFKTLTSKSQQSLHKILKLCYFLFIFLPILLFFNISDIEEIKRYFFTVILNKFLKLKDSKEMEHVIKNLDSKTTASLTRKITKLPTQFNLDPNNFPDLYKTLDLDRFISNVDYLDFLMGYLPAILDVQFHNMLNDTLIELNKSRFIITQDEYNKTVKNILNGLLGNMKLFFSTDENDYSLNQDINTVVNRLDFIFQRANEITGWFSKHLLKGKLEKSITIAKSQNDKIDAKKIEQHIENMISNNFILSKCLNIPIKPVQDSIITHSIKMYLVFIIIVYVIHYSIISHFIDICDVVNEYLTHRDVLVELYEILSYINVKEEKISKNYNNLHVGQIHKLNVNNFSYATNIMLPNLRKKIFKNTNINIHPGNNIIVGPSGMGKSTIFSIITKLAKKDKFNSIDYHINAYDQLLNQQEVNAHNMTKEQMGDAVTYIPQKIMFPQNCSIENAAHLFLGSVGAENLFYFKLLRQLLILQGLKHISIKRKFSTLSGGEQQRVGVALIMLKHIHKENNIILADEPTIGIDSNYRNVVNNLLFNLTSYLKAMKYKRYLHRPNQFQNIFHDNNRTQHSIAQRHFIHLLEEQPNTTITITHTLEELLKQFNIDRLHVITKNRVVAIDRDNEVYRKSIEKLYKHNKQNSIYSLIDNYIY